MSIVVDPSTTLGMAMCVILGIMAVLFIISLPLLVWSTLKDIWRDDPWFSLFIIVSISLFEVLLILSAVSQFIS